MSEQTPSSPDNLQDDLQGSSLSDGEPSMEDILASIRKIISEDEPVALESPEDEAFDVLSDAELEMVEPDLDLDSALDAPLIPVAETVHPSSEVVDLDVEAVLSDMELEPAPFTTDDLEEDDNILDLLNMEIPLESEPEALAEDAADVSPDSSDEMDSLLDDILMAPDDETTTVEEPAPPATVDNDPDLELVKTLMADLSDDEGQETQSQDELEALLAIPEIEGETEMSVPAVEETAAEEVEAEEDILGDILNMTLDDEIRTHPEDLSLDEASEPMTSDMIAEDERANLEANSVAEQIETASDADELPSLADIAAAAEADAAEAETAAVSAPNPVAATAGLTAAGAGLTALGATVLGEEPADETETKQPELTKHVPTPKEPSMPVQAVNNDTILDDVTESAAAGAFAELSSVVEEKAVFNERGPRIGDLVQEALRPMLKEWLDANLKGIVERAVAKEVKRISTGK